MSSYPISNVAPSPPSSPTLLVVESEVLVRLPLAEYLRECGFRVFEARDVVEAKTILGAGIPVDLVFAGVNLPGDQNGFALASWVRQHHPETKVLLTAHLGRAVDKAGDICEEGPNGARPYTHEVVLQRIQTLLAAAKRERST
jgi:DNA-binding response OmpR family regulator